MRGVGRGGGLKIRIFLRFASPFVTTLKFAPPFQKSAYGPDVYAGLVYAKIRHGRTGQGRVKPRLMSVVNL